MKTVGEKLLEARELFVGGSSLWVACFHARVSLRLYEELRQEARVPIGLSWLEYQRKTTEVIERKAHRYLSVENRLRTACPGCRGAGTHYTRLAVEKYGKEQRNCTRCDSRRWHWSGGRFKGTGTGREP